MPFDIEPAPIDDMGTTLRPNTRMPPQVFTTPPPAAGPPMYMDFMGPSPSPGADIMTVGGAPPPNIDMMSTGPNLDFYASFAPAPAPSYN